MDFLKWTNLGLFYLFSFFLHVKIQILFDISVDGVLRIRTHGGRMKGTDESTEHWQHPKLMDLLEII